MAEENRLFQVEIITPDRVFYTGEGDMIEFTTASGEIGVYKKHIPLTTVLALGIVKIHKTGEDDVIAAVHSGFAEILPDKVSSTWRRNALSVSIRFVTALHEWSTVAWLRPPMADPIVVSGALVCCLARYMAICRAWAISRVRSVELKRAKSRLRYSHTTSMMWSMVISFW